MFKRAIQILLIFFIFLSFPLMSVYASSCSVAYPIPAPPDNTCNTSDSVSVTAVVPNSSATFNGFASASSTITFKDNGAVSGTAVTDASGNFSKTIVSSPGLHDFAISLTDTSARSTPETTFSGVSVSNQSDTPVSSILLPPSVDLTRTSIKKGESTTFLGQGSSGSTVHVILNNGEVYSQVIGGGSDWQYTFNSGYVTGANSLYAFLTRPGSTDSINSFTLSLTVGNCGRSDLNCDGRVNLTDFSILLYYWDTNNSLADTNQDGTVGLIDFSIMLFDWTD